MPDNMPIEGWPTGYRGNARNLTLDDVQRDKLKRGGDRHAIVVDPINRMLYEFYQAKKTDTGWEAAPGLDLRPEDQQAAAGRLDLGRRRGLADFPGRRPLRRTAARHGRACDAGDRGQDPPGLRRPGHALCQPA